MAYFEIANNDKVTKARVGRINTAHGVVNTPAFMPIGTKGAVKAITPQELKDNGADIILANTYHLWQRPGDDLIKRAGGLHKFMGWSGPILTDSGGFQVFSLAKTRKITEEGVNFRFDMDGRQELLSPEKSIDIQANLGSDIALILDSFPGYPFEYQKSEESVALTKRWAERAIKQHKKIMSHGKTVNPGQKLWGIVQGANFTELREQSARGMVELGFPGFAIGGVAVGESPEEMLKAVDKAVPYLPAEAPRHLLGVGKPQDIVEAVARGCDTFDCVIPTREARHGRLYIDGLTTLDIRLEKFREDFTPPDENCDCYMCRHFTKAYMRHLFAMAEPLAIRLFTMHNLMFYLKLMADIRRAISSGTFTDILQSYAAL